MARIDTKQNQKPLRLRLPVTVRRVGAVLSALALTAVALVPAAPPSAAQGDGNPLEPSPPNPRCPGYDLDHDDPRISWTEVTPPDSSLSYGDIFFLDAQRGWAVGQPGVIVFTDNGGATWRRGVVPSDSSSIALNEVFFADERNGWAMAGRGDVRVLRTTDGGLNWSNQALPDLSASGFEGARNLSLEGFSAVEVPPNPADPQQRNVRLWITGHIQEGDWPDIRDRGLLFTDHQKLNDPAGRWEVQEVKEQDGTLGRVLGNVHFFDGSEGLATSKKLGEQNGARNEREGAIFATKNGGQTWVLERMNPETSYESYGGGFAHLAFTDRDHGHVYWHKDAGPDKGQYWKAKPDGGGGRAWNPETICQPWPTESAFVSGPNCPPEDPACNGLIGRNFGSPVGRTTDGGATWVPDYGPDDPGVQQTNDPYIYEVSYPVPSLAYGTSTRAGFAGRIFKASITIVEVDSILPKEACPGAVVTIKGYGFTDKSTVSFGTTKVPQSDVTYVSLRELKVKVPPRAGLEKVPVSVTTPESEPGKGDQLGTSLTDDNTEFTYLGGIIDPAALEADPPTVKSVTPNRGKVAGGEIVLVSGNNLACAQSVVFRDSGGKAKTAAEPKVLPDGRVSVKAPPWEGPGVVDVVVNTPGIVGPEIPSVPESATANDYTYVAETTPLPLDDIPGCAGCGGGGGGGSSGNPPAPPGNIASTSAGPSQSAITLGAPPSPPGSGSPGTVPVSGPAGQPLTQPVLSTGSLGMEAGVAPDPVSAGTSAQAAQPQPGAGFVPQAERQPYPAPRYAMVAAGTLGDVGVGLAGGALFVLTAGCMVLLPSRARPRAAAAAGISSGCRGGGRGGSRRPAPAAF